MTDRAEVRALYEQRDGHLPSRRAAWVPRASGAWSGQRRLRAAVRHLRSWRREVPGPHRMVAMNAPLMPLAGRLSGLSERWCAVDTEIQHRSLRWLNRGITDVVVPTHWREDLDGEALQAGYEAPRLDGGGSTASTAPINTCTWPPFDGRTTSPIRRASWCGGSWVTARTITGRSSPCLMRSSRASKCCRGTRKKHPRSAWRGPFSIASRTWTGSSRSPRPSRRKRPTSACPPCWSRRPSAASLTVSKPRGGLCFGTEVHARAKRGWTSGPAGPRAWR